MKQVSQPSYKNTALISTLAQQAEEAAGRIRSAVIETPVEKIAGLLPDDIEVFFKLENLQPIGSFKLRGAGNALLTADPARLREGVYTASAGNMAQGVGWNARRLGIPFTTIVPDHAPEAKLAAITRLGGKIIKVTVKDAAPRAFKRT
jgi:threonine dehydratase